MSYTGQATDQKQMGPGAIVGKRKSRDYQCDNDCEACIIALRIGNEKCFRCS